MNNSQPMYASYDDQKHASGYAYAVAPSAPPLNDVPIARPIEYHPPQGSYAMPAPQPALQAYSGSYHQEHVQREESCRHQKKKKHGCLCAFVSDSIQLAGFHMLNAVLGCLSFSLVIAGVVASIALLPLCCFGIVVFRLLLYVVNMLAQLDVQLHNFISPQDQRVYVQLPHNIGFFGLSGQRLSPSLSSFSPVALMTALYFATIKFALAIVSTASLSLTASGPSALIAGLTNSRVWISVGTSVWEYQDDPLGLILVSCVLFLAGVLSMRWTATLSCRATRFFCCERFSTHRYIQTSQQPLYPTAVATYGAATTYSTV